MPADYKPLTVDPPCPYCGYDRRRRQVGSTTIVCGPCGGTGSALSRVRNEQALLSELCAPELPEPSLHLVAEVPQVQPSSVTVLMPSEVEPESVEQAVAFAG